MPGPNGVITISGDPKNALEAEVANLELAEVELDTFSDAEASTTTDEVTMATRKKPRSNNKGPEAQAAPRDPSNSNWVTPNATG